MSPAAGGRGMTTDRWRRVEALFHEMLARPADERRAALAAACAGDAALQADVQSLLDQSESGGRISRHPRHRRRRALRLAARACR